MKQQIYDALISFMHEPQVKDMVMNCNIENSYAILNPNVKISVIDLTKGKFEFRCENNANQGVTEFKKTLIFK